MNKRQLLAACLPLAGSMATFPLKALATTVALPETRSLARRPAAISIPIGYAQVAAAVGIPASVLFAVACQESVMLFGSRALPYPWTLGLKGQGLRFATYEQAVVKLQELIDAGMRNIDCCLMQVNWGYHRARLLSPEQAMDPYPNMLLGATMLREHFDTVRDWPRAIARYHQPAETTRAQTYSHQVLARIERMHRQAKADGHA